MFLNSDATLIILLQFNKFDKVTKVKGSVIVVIG